jgi:hypothetical protein
MTRATATRVMSRVLAVTIGVLPIAEVAAQGRDGRLTITVADQTGAVIPEATVTVARLDGNSDARAVAPQSVQTSLQGVATLTGLAPGRYALKAEFPGFETSILADVRVRAGDNKQAVTLAIQKLEDTVVVGQDAQTAAADPRGRAFGSAMTREQIDALSDDPAEMRRQIEDMVGGAAILRVDSFEGAQLPMKSQIRSIRISRDAFAAEFHNAGGIFIDIITQPGVGPVRGQAQMRLRDGALSGRSPFTPTKGAERTQDYGFGVGGTLIPQRAQFSLNVQGTTAFETPNLNAALPGGVRSEALSLRQPRQAMNVGAYIDYAVTKDQVLRLGYNSFTNSNSNLGIGLYDLPERAFSSDTSNHQLRIQETGPLGRRFFTNTRLFLNLSDSQSTSATEAQTIRVNDAFTSGGQQVAGGRRARNVTVASDLDYVRSIHSIRTGLSVDGSWNHSDATSNYLGTYTFESLDAFNQGRPRSFSRRIGDPVIDYFNVQGGLYVQDDIRVRPGLTLSPGVRYELQTHVSDYNNIGPRFGVTWSPSRNGRTTLRGSAGLFYDWLNLNTYEQTVRVDGFRQREINIPEPSFPDPGTDGIIPPANRYLLGDGVRMPRNLRFSAGVDQIITPLARLGVQYAHVRGTGLMRGDNLNAPTDGVRPDPAFFNIVEVVSDARSRQDTISMNFEGGLATQWAPLLPRSAARFDVRRIRFNTFYTLGWWRNDTDGDFALPPGGTLDSEWGFAPQDVRHRFGVNSNSQMLKGLQFGWNLNASTGTPYTIRTGLDENGDLVFNDRPAGADRNSERAALQWNLNTNATYAFTFGHRGGTLPPGIFITAGGAGAPNIQTFAVENWRYRLAFFVNVQNVTNRANYIGYSGVLTSPFFGKPTAVASPRKVDIGMNLRF